MMSISGVKFGNNGEKEVESDARNGGEVGKKAKFVCQFSFCVCPCP